MARKSRSPQPRRFHPLIGAFERHMLDVALAEQFDGPIHGDDPFEFCLLAKIISRAFADAYGPLKTAFYSQAYPHPRDVEDARAFFEDGRIEVYAGALGLTADTVIGMAAEVMDYAMREGFELAT